MVLLVCRCVVQVSDNWEQLAADHRSRRMVGSSIPALSIRVVVCVKVVRWVEVITSRDA